MSHGTFHENGIESDATLELHLEEGTNREAWEAVRDELVALNPQSHKVRERLNRAGFNEDGILDCWQLDGCALEGLCDLTVLCFLLFFFLLTVPTSVLPESFGRIITQGALMLNNVSCSTAETWE